MQPSCDDRGREGVPGVAQTGGYQEGLYRVLPSRSDFEAYLWNMEVNSVHTAV